MPNVQAVLDAARAHADAGRVAQAESLVRRALQSDPRNPDLLHAVALVLLHASKPEQALYFAQRAAAAAPLPGPLSTLGTILAQSAKPDEAIDAFQRALALSPAHIPSTLGLANTLRFAHRYEDASDACLAALALLPREPSLVATASAALVDAGRVPEAIALIDDTGDDRAPIVTQALLFAINYLDLDPQRIFREHAAFGRALRASLGPPASLRATDPDKRLRVGFLSPDFRAHSVAYFIQPLLEHRSRFHALGFSNVRRGDATTQRLRALTDEWFDVHALHDDALAALIREKNVDILVDLAGHTLAHRLGVFARRAAPLQATFIGYPNTTGLDTMDIRLVDSTTDPEAMTLATERLVRIDACFLCYRPPADAPDPAPRDPASPLTLGSFNVLPKISPAAADLWCDCLRALPDSRLLLKCNQLTDPRVRARALSWFTSRGIDAERLDLLPPTPTTREHLALYARLDLALDTFPYAGTTTTCEALWMGVPVVTLEGRTHVSRVGSSLLHAAGLSELIAHDAPGFVRTVVDLANDPQRLAALRAGLRARLAASPLTQGPSYAARVEDALQNAWRNHCAS